ncbi:MAG: protein tyrosine phosphatase family protein [Kangiellaceae bacterium]
MKVVQILILLTMVLFCSNNFAKNVTDFTELDKEFKTLTNFHFVADNLASSGYLKMEEYQLIKKYGFKHVINLIPGDQKEERAVVTKLGMSYQQIPVDWSEPSLDNFERFSQLMQRYGKNKVYVHCQANYRASTFVYLYRVTKLGVDLKTAKKDLLKIWTPNETWQGFIEKVLF